MNVDPRVCDGADRRIDPVASRWLPPSAADWRLHPTTLALIYQPFAAADCTWPSILPNASPSALYTHSFPPRLCDLFSSLFLFAVGTDFLLSVRYQQRKRKVPAGEMARGNQRDKAREKNLKEQAGKVRLSLTTRRSSCFFFFISGFFLHHRKQLLTLSQKSKNTVCIFAFPPHRKEKRRRKPRSSGETWAD